MPPCYEQTKEDRTAMQPNKTRADLSMDLLLAVFLIAFDVAARLLPHAPGIWPFAASALFAGRVMRTPALAVGVPLVAVLVSNAAFAGDDWRITLVVCAAVTLPAFAGILIRRWRQRHVSADLAGSDPVLRRSPAIPGQNRVRRSVLDGRAVRRSLADPAHPGIVPPRHLAEISSEPIPHRLDAAGQIGWRFGFS